MGWYAPRSNLGFGYIVNEDSIYIQGVWVERNSCVRSLQLCKAIVYKVVRLSRLIVIKKISLLILRVMSVLKYMMMCLGITYANLDNLCLPKLSPLPAISDNLAMSWLSYLSGLSYHVTSTHCFSVPSWFL